MAFAIRAGYFEPPVPDALELELELDPPPLPLPEEVAVVGISHASGTQPVPPGSTWQWAALPQSMSVLQPMRVQNH